MAKFTDQQIRDKGFLYIPKQQYLQKPFQIPTTEDATEDEVVTDEGIVNTNAFANSGGGMDFSPTGNMFGEGTPVDPVYGNTYIDTVKREGPDSFEAYNKLVEAGGTAPGGMYTSDYFPGTENELADAMGRMPGQEGYDPNMDYSEDAFQKANDKRGFLSKMFNKAGQVKEKLPSWAQAAITALNPLSIIPTLFGGEGGSGPKYGIAGLTDQQKAMYDALASQGMLFDSSGIMKTMTGKNLMGKGYLEGQIENFNEMTEEGYTIDSNGNVVKPDGTLASGYLKNKFLEANISGKGKTIKDTTLTPELINEFINNNNTTETPVGADTKTGPNINEEEGRPENPGGGYDGSQNERPDDKQDNDNDGGAGQSPADRPDNSGGGGHTNPGKGSYGPHFARGGRAGYFFGGKV
jgi:hypothetical protein